MLSKAVIKDRAFFDIRVHDGHTLYLVALLQPGSFGRRHFGRRDSSFQLKHTRSPRLHCVLGDLDSSRRNFGCCVETRASHPPSVLSGVVLWDWDSGLHGRHRSPRYPLEVFPKLWHYQDLTQRTATALRFHGGRSGAASVILPIEEKFPSAVSIPHRCSSVSIRG